MADPAALRSLPPDVRDLAYALAARSNHPVSRCLAAALSSAGARLEGSARVEEIPGHGLELLRDGHCVRLGSPAGPCRGWRPSPERQCCPAMDSCWPASARCEAVRPGVRRALQQLRGAGLDVWLLSGDDEARVADFARRVDLPPGRALGRAEPGGQGAAGAASGPAGHPLPRRRGQRRARLRPRPWPPERRRQTAR